MRPLLVQAALFVLLLTSPVGAQQPPGSGVPQASGSPVEEQLPEVSPVERPVARAFPASQVPVLDGDVLDDPAWQDIEPIAGFWQTTPNEGRPASERTEVRIVYTATTLYIGVVCYDRDPASIIVADSRRDSPLNETDSFQIIFDTYRDRQNGFVFGTNPAAVEYDGQVVNEGEGGGGLGGRQQGGSGGGFNINWDGSWEVRTRISEIGWSAEFAIPFRTLRYPSVESHVWGVNFQRNIRRRNETAYWAPLPRQYNLFRLSMAGTLTGLVIPGQRNLTLTPYVLGQAHRDGLRAAGTSWLGDVGGDLKYSLTPSLTLDVTVNTDFAQVEVDEQQISLDRFNLFFPEKRPFFLENAGLFTVGSPGEAEIFFSRRIGIGPGGLAIPILGGGRLSGKVAGTNVGVLNMQTDGVLDLAPANNFSVVRISRELPNRSSLGGIFVNRQGTGRLSAGEDYNRSFGADGRLGIGRHGSIGGFLARTQTPGLDGHEQAFQATARYDSQAWLLNAGYTDVGAGFNPEVGFLTRHGGFRKPEFLVFHRYRPGNFLRLHEVRPHVSYRGFWTPGGFQEHGFLHLDSHYEWRNGYEVHTGLNLTRQGLERPFPIHPGIAVPAGTYDHREAQIVAFTNRGHWWSASLRLDAGGFFGGRRIAPTPGLRVRRGETFNTELSWSRNDVRLPAGSFVTNLARARLSYSFSPRVFLQSLLQYNDRADLWSANLRFGWLQQANTGVFIVYTDTRGLDDGFDTGLARPDRSLVVKYSRIFDLLR